uniref:Uncharacterized protein n=1 Tax=Panagrolaimus sp. PS1159 TaxID=55785 RepID=A0AC35G5V7_9BILA
MPETSSGNLDNAISCDSASTSTSLTTPSTPSTNTASIFRYPRQLLPSFYNTSFKKSDNSKNIIYQTTTTKSTKYAYFFS